MSHIKSFSGALLVICVLVFASSLSFSTEGASVEPARTVKLGIDYQVEGTPVAGASFSLYRVAEVLSDGSFSATHAFAGYPVSFNDLDSSDLHALACTLSGYCARDGLTACDSGLTDESGTLFFPVTKPDMLSGLYLVVGDQVVVDEFGLSPDPFLVSLPAKNPAGGWTYDVTALPKAERKALQGEVLAGLDVVKIWENDIKSRRPDAVDIELLRNGTVHDTVTLSAEDGWQHMWPALDPADSWQVVEYPVPVGYIVSVDREGSSFKITNRFVAKSLPQTGMLRWPVLLLGAGGLVFLVWGRFRRKGHPPDA